MRTQRFFRYLWRVNAVLIALAFAGIALVLVAINLPFRGGYAQPAAAAAPPIPGKPPNKELVLGSFRQLGQTTVFRATLSTEERGGRKGLGSYSSSDSSSELHNMLIADVVSGTSRWLLPGDKELIANYEDVMDGPEKPPLATIALVKPPNEENGRLLIFDIAAQHIEQVAANVRTIDGVTIVPSGDIAVLFQKNRKYYLASFDRVTRAKTSEREIPIPPLH